MNTILDEVTDEAREAVRRRRAVFVRRRFIWLFLPLIAAFAGLYIVASTLTLTINGLALLAAGALILIVAAAAWDASESRGDR